MKVFALLLFLGFFAIVSAQWRADPPIWVMNNVWYEPDCKTVVKTFATQYGQCVPTGNTSYRYYYYLGQDYFSTAYHHYDTPDCSGTDHFNGASSTFMYNSCFAENGYRASFLSNSTEPWTDLPKNGVFTFRYGSTDNCEAVQSPISYSYERNNYCQSGYSYDCNQSKDFYYSNYYEKDVNCTKAPTISKKVQSLNCQPYAPEPFQTNYCLP